MPEIPVVPDSKPATPKTADDINDMFKELDNETPEPEKPKKSAPKEEEDKPKKDIEEVDDEELELKEPEEDVEKLDLKEDENLDIDAPPRKKEILAKFPELFKTFPFLEKMMYRDREYTQLFGSFDDAKEIAEKAEVWASLENNLLEGNTEQLLKEVKESDERAFNIIVDDYLKSLYNVDKDAYFHVVNNQTKRIIMSMVEEANEQGNDDLKQAALMLHQFVFGKSKFEAPKPRVEDRSKKEDSEAESERVAFMRERFETARDELQSQADNTLRATISDYIDPKGQMTSYVKKNAVNDAMRIISAAIVNDQTAVKNLDKLWRASTEQKFSKDSLGRIRSYYLSQAKRNLKDAILKARAEALKDVSSRSREIEEETPARETTRRIPTGRPSQSTRGKTDGPRKGESVSDFFMRD